MTPNNLSKLFPLLLVGLFTAFVDLPAAPLSFPEYNFSVELPPGWTLVKPTPAGTLSVAKNPRGIVQVVVFAKRMSPTNLSGVRDGLKKSLTGHGMILQPDQEFKIGDRPFVLVFGHNPSLNVTIANYLTGTEGEVVTLGFTINGSLTKADPDIDAIVRSLRFLSLAPNVPVSTPPPSALAAQPSAIAAAPDYGPTKRAITDFEAAMQSLTTAVPAIQDAAGVVKALDRFSAVTDAFGSAVEDLLRKNPDLAKLKEPPAELAELWGSFASAQKRWEPTMKVLLAGVSKFKADPGVQAAVVRLQHATAHLQPGALPH